MICSPGSIDPLPASALVPASANDTVPRSTESRLDDSGTRANAMSGTVRLSDVGCPSSKPTTGGLPAQTAKSSPPCATAWL